ncbi:BTB/POZ domain-containing protein 17 [Teleopsis dalmanni]|uniref:BTB/POZ domain-containing protein 17 n=1 Tax=Teleopsis dalmanni TaxID=139649 RepID=UPI000D32C00D|nr:BTB/POZ domain-containing protein 17 [Teleopsis dalmanni]XP_037938552.1 BTB/POZ domain-containing protein 17 [Teleopsis dalmanni]XP_037938553.1 BTB/POZ domain-containing protein 17 [Teleopsis dalmanni]
MADITGGHNEKPGFTKIENMDTDDISQDGSLMNNSQSVLEKIANLYAEQLMSDIILVVGTEQYPAHRVILCASSEVFQVMLMNPEWNECRKRVIELVEEPCCTAVFPQFLKYLYVGQIKITLQTVMPMLALADKYNVKDLVELCVDYMMKHIAKAATQGYLVSWLQYTIAFSPSHVDLTESLKRFLKWNLEIVSESKDFVELDLSIMVLLLQQNDVVVISEYQLFKILQSWLLHRRELLENDDTLTLEEKDSCFQSLIEQTVIHIRFAMMSPRELAHLLLFPLLEYGRNFIIERLAIGMSYHSGHEERVEEVRKSRDGKLQFTPRLYSNDTWSVSIEVHKFDQIEKYKNYVTCFFSLRNIAETDDDHAITWEVEFFPRGVKYNRAKMVWGEDVPEFSLNTVRLRATCKHSNIGEERFKIAVLITGVQNNINHILTVHERTEYFSSKVRVLNIDNLIPFDELALSSIKLSPHLIGPERNNLSIQVIIAPMGPYTCRDVPPFDLK